MTDKVATRLQEIQQRGVQYRDAEVAGVDLEARTVELSFSSEAAEVPRWYGLEVLGHDPGECDLSRLNDNAAALWNHDWDDMRGKVEPGTARIDGDKRGRCTLRFSRSADGEQLLQDIADGIVTKVSVGYRVLGIKLTEERENVDVYRITAWEPLEISLVSVPADPSVGVGRSAEIPHLAQGEDGADNRAVNTTSQTNRDNDPMDKENEPKQPATPVIDVAAERRSAVEAENARVREINELGKAYGARDLAGDFAADPSKSVADFQRALLERGNKKAPKALGETSDIGMDERDLSQFSIVRVARALIDPADKAAQKAAGFEFEVSEAARAKYGKDNDHFVIPSDVLRTALPHSMATRVVNAGQNGQVGAGNTGGNLIQTTLLAGSYIDVLRNKATLMKNARILGGLVGNIDIPKQTAVAQGYWLGEDDDTTETGIDWGQITVSPKTCGAFSEVTRRLLMQSSLDVEALLRYDLAVQMALTIDKAGYYGTGTDKQPKGLTNYDGIHAVAFAGTQPTYAELVQMETLIALDNADVDGMRYIGNAAFRGAAKTTRKFPDAVDGGVIWEQGGTVNGYATDITNQIPTGDVLFGNFADLLVAMWGGLELMVDPYSNSKKGRIRLVTFQDVDIALRRTESFCVGRKA